MLRNWVAITMMLAASEALALDAAQLMSGMTWEKRVLLIFAPDTQHAEWQRQEKLLEAQDADLAERDMAVIRVLATGEVSVDNNPLGSAAGDFYRRFGVADDRFRAVLVGKDGSVKLESGEAVATTELFALIDSMPMRRQEMLQGD